jgi:hypothetical protein
MTRWLLLKRGWSALSGGLPTMLPQIKAGNYRQVPLSGRKASIPDVIIKDFDRSE